MSSDCANRSAVADRRGVTVTGSTMHGKAGAAARSGGYFSAANARSRISSTGPKPAMRRYCGAPLPPLAAQSE